MAVAIKRDLYSEDPLADEFLASSGAIIREGAGEASEVYLCAHRGG
jgi:hypothetical protein